jgi:hypothetical protein
MEALHVSARTIAWFPGMVWYNALCNCGRLVLGFFSVQYSPASVQHRCLAEVSVLLQQCCSCIPTKQYHCIDSGYCSGLGEVSLHIQQRCGSTPVKQHTACCVLSCNVKQTTVLWMYSVLCITRTTVQEGM